MQDPSIYAQLKPQFPDQEHLKCPRCDSANTKFCYYNNYNLSQPRHFCKNCRRYWTKGGALRNIPVGGGTRKSAKRSKRSSTPTSTTTTTSTSPPPAPAPAPISTSPSSAAAAVPPVLTSPTASTTPPATVQAEPKGEPFAASLLPAFGNYGSILSTGEGQYGDFYDGSNLQLYGFGENGSADPGAGQPGNGDHINSEVFLNSHQSNNGEAGIWNGTNGWPDLAIYTPGSNFQ